MKQFPNPTEVAVRKLGERFAEMPRNRQLESYADAVTALAVMDSTVNRLTLENRMLRQQMQRMERLMAGAPGMEETS